jgi:N-acyl-L-homoserine lactone synthetase
MDIVTGTAETLPAGLLFDMAHYRYRVFIERLGWKLAHTGRIELDEFDRRDTLYVIARNDKGTLRGVARLLPTSRPYLLADVFPQLLGGRTPPRSPDVWELSRFAALDPDAAAHGATRFGASDDALCLLDEAMRAAVLAGARTLVTASPIGIERILGIAGIAACRLAPPVEVDGQRMFACRIDLAPALALHRRKRAGSISTRPVLSSEGQGPSRLPRQPSCLPPAASP